jgi:uncharacterized protein
MENKINFLVDTNVWLERLLEQKQARKVADLLNFIPSEFLSVSDFSLHSIGVILNKLNKLEIYIDFINDLFSYGSVSCLHSEPSDNLEVIKIIEEKRLDFDDAYQVMIAGKYDLQIVTFDKDFASSGIKILSPTDAIEKFRKTIK